MKTLFGTTIALSLLVSTALADDRKPANEADKFAGHESKAWSIVQDGMNNHMSAHAASQLKFLVYHAVAKELCDGVELDLEKIKSAKDDVHPENWSDLDDKDRHAWTYKYLVNYGVIFGVMLSEHADHTDAFCKGVNALIADKEEAKHTYFAQKAN